MKVGILLFVGSLVSIAVCHLLLFGLVMAILASLFGAALDGAKDSAKGMPSMAWSSATTSSPTSSASSTSVKDLVANGMLHSSQRIADSLTPVLNEHNRKMMKQAEEMRKKNPAPAPDYQTLLRRKELEALRAKQGDILSR